MLKLFKLLDRFRTKKVKTLTKEEIINETVDYYSVNSRSVNIGDKIGCAYNDSLGNHCAVGRCMLPKFKEQGVKLKGNTDTVGLFILEQKLKKVDDVLEPKYHGHDEDFWRDLQRIHDRSYYWVENGLSNRGKDFVKNLKEKYKKK